MIFRHKQEYLSIYGQSKGTLNSGIGQKNSSQRDSKTTQMTWKVKTLNSFHLEVGEKGAQDRHLLLLLWNIFLPTFYSGLIGGCLPLMHKKKTWTWLKLTHSQRLGKILSILYQYCTLLNLSNLIGLCSCTCILCNFSSEKTYVQ